MIVMPQIKDGITASDPCADPASMSDGDSDRALEVVFDPMVQKRRKSSMVESHFKPSACFVHSLLEAHKRRNSKGLKQVKEHAPASQDYSDRDDLEKLNTREHYDPANITYSTKDPEDGDDPSSRMLTKRQLSEMAVGVRELSKHLGNLRMKLRPTAIQVLIVTKLHDEALIGHTKNVVDWILSNYKDYTVYIEDVLKSHSKMDVKSLEEKHNDSSKRLRYWTNKFCTEHPHLFDLVVTLGGDGTVLYASWLFQRVVPPTLSFSLGSLGFLTLFDFDKYQDILHDAFTQGVTISLRMRFECTIMRAQCKDANKDVKDLCSEIINPETGHHPTHKPIASYSVLNELVVDRGPNATMSSTELFGDDEHLTTIQADGICIATPTGSTAYSLAAGGSLSHPDNPVMLVSPICAHSLSFRPLILPDSMVLRVGVPYDSRSTAWASFDGKERIELQQGDYVTIAASRFPFATVKPRKQQSDFFSSLSRTLQWNSRSATQKPFDKS